MSPAHLVDEPEVHLLVRVARLDEFQPVELPVEHVLQQRRQSVQAAGRLPTDRRHHELHVLPPVAVREDPRDHLQQPVVQPSLRRA